MGLRALLPLLLATALAGCYTGEASGRLAVAEFEVGEFSEVVMSGGGNVTVLPGEYAVSASAEDDVLPSLRVRSSGGKLHLGREVDWIDGVRPTLPIEYRVSLPRLDALTVSGNGAAKVRGVDSGDELALSASGAGSIDATPVLAATTVVRVDGAAAVTLAGLDADAFRAVVAGSGHVSATGVADRLDIEVDGSGLYRGDGLQGSSVRVKVHGAGQAFVWAEDRLDADVGGAGRVVYRGEPVIEKRVRDDDQLVRLASTRAVEEQSQAVDHLQPEYKHQAPSSNLVPMSAAQPIRGG